MRRVALRPATAAVALMALTVLAAGVLALGVRLTGFELGTGDDAPPTGPVTTVAVADAVEFAVIGDFGIANDAQMAVASAVRDWVVAVDAAALVTTGDNVYPDAEPKYFDAAWRTPYGWAQDSGFTVLASLGNHDVSRGYTADVMDLLEMPSRWYAHQVGPVEIFVLDSTNADHPAQRAWLEAALASSTAAWQVAVFHHPVYSCAKHGPEADVHEHWVPLFEAGGVDLVLTGHDHNYQRFGPVDGVRYVVSGGAGAALYEILSCGADHPLPTVTEDERHHFLGVEANEHRLQVVAFDARGAAFDAFVVEAGARR